AQANHTRKINPFRRIILTTPRWQPSSKHCHQSGRSAYVNQWSNPIWNHAPPISHDGNPNFSLNLPPISCLVWNVQGAGRQAFLASFNEILRVNQPIVVAFVETHMGSEQAEFIASKFSFGGYIRVDADGFSGEIWVYWKNEVVTITQINQST
ncbi:Glutamate--tRNA ligase, partial [Bienertia sinuspersici]